EDLLTLHLSPAVSTTMQSPSIITSAVTTAGLENTEGHRNPSLVNLGATVGVVVATAVLITPVYVMLIFLWWKKREQLKGRQRISMAATLTLVLLLQASRLKLNPQPGNSAGYNRVKEFGVNQPAYLSGVQGGSIEISFSFYFPWELTEDPQMTILWRWKDFHGEFIYNSTSGFIHEHFKDRLTLNWTQPQTSGVLKILDLKEEDQNTYFCRVHLKARNQKEMWQSISGTRLTITRVRTTMQSPSIVTSAVTTAELEDTEGQRNPSLVNLGATVGVVVATTVLITPVYVMLIFLWWKRRPAD
ncbi:hypothetical protein U0070_002083, partial [Myodes glareolus]